MFGWLCRATYCSVVSTSMLKCTTCCPKREETLEVYTEWYRISVLPGYLLFLCLVYHMLFKTRRNSGSLHWVIGEVLVLGLLVVCKIPYSKLYFEYSSCSCLSYEYLLMVSPDVVDIGSEYFVVCRAYVYVGLVMPSYLFFCIYFNACYITCCPKREETLEA